MYTDQSMQPEAALAAPGPSSKTVRLMAAIGLGALGVATVAGVSSMASTERNPMPGATFEQPNPNSVETPFDPIAFEEDPDAIYWGGDGEFYCPPCGMG